MIPRKIHYCWFGGAAMPRRSIRFIKGWERLMPGYEIVRWDESNFDVGCIPYVEEAYRARKYAFVSDYARMKIIHDIGGVYLDTDVEMIRPIQDILDRGGFMAMERNSNILAHEQLDVAPGLGFAAAPGDPLIAEIMQSYHKRHFILADGSQDCTTIVRLTTDILKRHGLTPSRQIQRIGQLYVYPPEYFCPKEFLVNRLRITPDTRTIHHYAASWLSFTDRISVTKGFLVDKIRKILRSLKAH